jgi:outer membrane protein
MSFARASLFCGMFLLLAAPPLRAQHALPPPGRRPAQVALHVKGRKSAQGLPGPQEFRQYVVAGKLLLSVEDAIRLALANNTDIHLDQAPIGNAHDSIERAEAPFEPDVRTGFNATRTNSPTYTQLQGAPTLSSLNQQANLGVSETFETGTNVQLGLSANKLSSNSTFNFFNPSENADFAFSFSQPLLRGRGLFPNRAPIVIAQRNLDQARDTFEAEVNDIIQAVVSRYWQVVQARENLAVQKKSLAEARQSYQHDERALKLGALPQLDIYSSQSQVAQRRVVVIQAQYALLQAEDNFRNVIGADIDPGLRSLPLDLTEKPEPSGTLMSVNVSTALEKALNNRPEIESVREQLMNDRTSIRLAHNELEPDLSLTGTFQSNGLGGDQINNAVTPPVIVSTGGFGQALNQVFGFGYPVYGMGFTLTLPIHNRSAQADLGDALVSRRRDLYSERRIRQTITLDVTNAVHQLEQSKLSMQAAKTSYSLAKKNLQAQQHKYELGAGQIQFVLQAQTELAQAEQSLVNAQVGYRLAVTAVQHATGRLLDRFHVQITNLAR